MKSDYNTKWGGGADLHDQLQVYYSIDRKGVKWWRRVLCEMSVLNSFILHNLVHGKSRQIKNSEKNQAAVWLSLIESTRRRSVARTPPNTPDQTTWTTWKTLYTHNSHIRHRCRVCAKQKTQ